MADVPSIGFDAVAAAGITTLILGSLPSRRSTAAGQYYGHPRNAFWRIMGELVDAGPDRPYADRTRRLTEAGIGLWDVLASSVRPGSMDSDIDLKTARANDFAAFLTAYPRVSRIFFNGRTAAALFRRFDCLDDIARKATIELATLPSTSPAFAAMSFEEKLDRWSIVIEANNAVR